MNDLEYGPVIVTRGPHKGKIGIYDDDDDCGKKTAIVYLAFEDDYRMFNPSWLMTLDTSRIFEITMGQGFEKSSASAHG